jgi:WhiB family transcriptional regulator, redox-sensing transcriptional regulator
MGSVARTTPYILSDPGPRWVDKAACRDEPDKDIWFASKDAQDAELAAKAVCARCPVRDACRAWALETNQTSGIWGGMSEAELRAMRLSSAPTLEAIVFPLCSKDRHEMTPENTRPNGECGPCRAIHNADYRAKDGVVRYECPSCGRRIAAAHGGTHLSSHKDYSREGAYCPPQPIPTEVEQ